MTSLLEKIKFNGSIGTPFIYKGVEYSLSTDYSVPMPPDWSKKSGSVARIVAQCHANGLPETLEILDGTEVIDFSTTDRAAINDIKEIILPSSVIYIEQKSFLGSCHLQKMTPIRGCFIGYAAFNYAGLKYVDVEESSIGPWAFANSSVVRANLRDCLMGKGVFKDCKDLQTVRMNKYWDGYFEDSVPEQTFLGCRSLTEVSLIPNAKKVDDQAFCGCSSLVNIDLSECCKLNFEALGYCSSIRQLDISNCVTIRQRVLYKCTSLQFLNIQGAYEIGAETFEKCTSLEYIVGPVSCPHPESLGDCISLKVVFTDDPAQWALEALDNVLPSSVKFIVPENVYSRPQVRHLIAHRREVEPVKDIQGCINECIQACD